MTAVAKAAPPSVTTTLVASRSVRVVFVLLAMWTYLALDPATRDVFLRPENISNLTAQVAEIVVLGVGMTFVILIGGIDLSVGAGIALAGVIAAKLQIDMQQPAWVAVLAAVAVFALVGAWHGFLVTRMAIPPFIATLSGFLAYRGAAIVLADSRGLAPMRDDFLTLGAPLPPWLSPILSGLGLGVGVAMILARGARRKRLGLVSDGAAMLGFKIGAVAITAAFFMFVYKGGIPFPVLLAAGAAAAGAFVLRRTRLGRYAFAIGGNADAARLSGVPVARVTMAIYILMGVLAAVAGVIVDARGNGVTPSTAGLTRELHVITAVVVGGTSLSGGRGTMLGTVIGALIFGTLANGMNHKGIDANWQNIITGMILLGASMLDSLSTKKR